MEPPPGMNKAELKVIEPATGHVQDSVVLWLHGADQQNLEWITRLERIIPQFPTTKWIFPQAYTRPVSIGGPPRRVWFDLQALPPSAEEIKVPPLNAQLQIETTVGDFIQLIEAEVASGIPLRRVFIIGYSNGGATSLLTWLIGLKGAAIGGLGVFAGWLHNVQRAKEALQAPDAPDRNGGDYTPVLWVHGAEDDIIPLALALEGRTILKEEGLASETDFNIKEYKGEGHEVNSTQLDDMIAWLHTRVNTKGSSD